MALDDKNGPPSGIKQVKDQQMFLVSAMFRLNDCKVILKSMFGYVPKVLSTCLKHRLLLC